MKLVLITLYVDWSLQFEIMQIGYIIFKKLANGTYKFLKNIPINVLSCQIGT